MLSASTSSHQRHRAVCGARFEYHTAGQLRHDAPPTRADAHKRIRFMSVSAMFNTLATCTLSQITFDTLRAFPTFFPNLRNPPARSCRRAPQFTLRRCRAPPARAAQRLNEHTVPPLGSHSRSLRCTFVRLLLAAICALILLTVLHCSLRCNRTLSRNTRPGHFGTERRKTSASSNGPTHFHC